MLLLFPTSRCEHSRVGGWPRSTRLPGLTNASIAVEKDRAPPRLKMASHAMHMAEVREAKGVISKKKQRRLRGTVDEGRAVNRRDRTCIGHAVGSYTHSERGCRQEQQPQLVARIHDVM